ncbi:hypothetical protein CYLTODRAFT_342688 [Cylindrobasidium torrendii FP15055 ss-10]|uniref:Nucleic acid-binding protein n=1 Tax=Cylindrobasidium torrendii FP15055 ss-10 TaxID=1314674 RepID=A0A0D7BUB1_9AGAR|nr:hypothetical protein CYLTODRAFT_342688 [Cylindrobasidium torrendii FP15055 ss-10]
MRRVFLGAPTANDLKYDSKTSFSWTTLPDTNYNDASHATDTLTVNGTAITWSPTQNRSGVLSFLNTTTDSQETEDSFTQSQAHSDSSSIAQFPQFHFSLNSLTTLESLHGHGSKQVSMLLAVLEIQGPDGITLRKGKDAGREVYLLKLTLGDSDNQVCTLTAWRETAENWGGLNDSPGIQRGDIVHIQNVKASFEPDTRPSLTASPYLKSNMDICYRTIPRTEQDNGLRPDLRLALTDPAVRHVSRLVGWFTQVFGVR